jgi:hypothetical protein
VARTCRNATSVTSRASRWSRAPLFPPLAGISLPPGALGAPPDGRPGRGGLGTIAPSRTPSRAKESALSATDPNYDAATDTYRQIYRGHDNASAVTNAEGLTVFFDPDNHDVLGFSIANFSAYYEAHNTEDGEFEVNLPAKVPAPQEEEMDYDAEAIRSGVRIAEFY